MSHESQELPEALCNELEQLLSLATVGEASDAELDRLNSLLRTHEGLRKHAACFLRDEALLREELQVLCASELLAPDAASTSAVGELTKAREKREGIRGWFAGLSLRGVGLAACAAATVIVMGLVFSYAMYNKGRQDVQRDLAAYLPLKSTDNGVAVLTRAANDVWAFGRDYNPGDTIPPGNLKLDSGLARLEFYSGATVILEGPAELYLRSRNECFLRSGKLRARVPSSAQGFSIVTAETELVDIGTEFGLEATPTVGTGVHVFEGKVELYPPKSQRDIAQRTELLAGNGLFIDRSGRTRALDAGHTMFSSKEDMNRAVEIALREKAASWAAHSQQLKDDDRMLLYYDFEPNEENDQRLVSQDESNHAMDGAIVGCNWTDGRWPGKGALEFKRPGDRVRVNVPGQYDALTLAAWIRVDGLDRRFTAIMLTDDFDIGEIHWLIRWTGEIQLGISYPDTPQTLNAPSYASMNLGHQVHNFKTKPIMGLHNLGQWLHVAVRADNATGTVAHFLNGKKIHSESLPAPIKMRIGDADLGNWTLHTALKDPIRAFSGRIAEFMIMDEALSDAEINVLYREKSYAEGNGTQVAKR